MVSRSLWSVRACPSAPFRDPTRGLHNEESGFSARHCRPARARRLQQVGHRKAADNVRDAAENAADNIEAAASNAASNLENQATHIDGCGRESRRRRPRRGREQGRPDRSQQPLRPGPQAKSAFCGRPVAGARFSARPRSVDQKGSLSPTITRLLTSPLPSTARSTRTPPVRLPISRVSATSRPGSKIRAISSSG